MMNLISFTAIFLPHSSKSGCYHTLRNTSLNHIKVCPFLQYFCLIILVNIKTFENVYFCKTYEVYEKHEMSHLYKYLSCSHFPHILQSFHYSLSFPLHILLYFSSTLSTLICGLHELLLLINKAEVFILFNTITFCQYNISEHFPCAAWVP